MIAVLIMTVTAFILGLVLVLTDLFINKKDKNEEEYLKRLPGYNCGACGYGSCSGMAKAMIQNIEAYKKLAEWVKKDENPIIPFRKNE